MALTRFLSSAPSPALRLSTTRLSSTAAAVTAGFHNSANLNALKEADRNRPNLADIYGQLRQQELQKAKEGKRAWNESLASESEENVKADRGEVKDPKFDAWSKTKQATAAEKEGKVMK
ncbi:hypothetical protein AJ80_06988 [Polytolypa hystricis UAMH7299]|uniref:Uncharacterized protein n=1 Tax=Polytolypa hystricis (strain UAMH7299) TaxID=1447883 RepID=A0A2B7XTB0_POLH7|nr:hypothetical protein AJ80_06988 [Polytolypa hystricis UAMH7299]